MRLDSKAERLPAGRRVMLIDDDREILELLAEWLGSRGYEVRTLGDGARAVEEARAFQPHVVVLDGVLRKTTGFAVADGLRAAGIDCRIVFLSGLPRADLPAEDWVLEKPVDLHLLEATLRRAIEGRGAPQTESAIQRR